MVEPIEGETKTIELSPDADQFYPRLAKAMWRELLENAGKNQPGRYDTTQATRDIATLEAIARSIESGTHEQIEV